MFMVLLKFATNKADAGRLVEGHKACLQRGFDDGVFLVTGSLRPQSAGDGGGGIVAHNTSREALQQRLNEDPFVAEGVVSPEIYDVDASRTDQRLDFLLKA